MKRTRLQEDADKYLMMASILTAASTPRLIKELKQKVRTMYDIEAICPRAVCISGKTSIKMSTVGYVEMDYDDLLEWDTVSVDTRYLFASKTVKKGYVSAQVDFRARIPNSVIALLRDTGNIRTEVSTYSTVSCSS